MDYNTQKEIAALQKRLHELENKLIALHNILQQQPEIIKQALIEHNRLPSAELFNVNH
jgi:hypothetical protein